MRSFCMHSPVYLQLCSILVYKLNALTEYPLTSSNLPISTLSVYLSRLRVGQYFAICRSVLVRQYGSDNVGAILYYINRTVVKIFWKFN